MTAVRALAGIGLAVALALVPLAAPAADAPPSADTAAKEAPVTMESATRAAAAVAKRGPAELALADQAVLKLPQGYLFIPAKEANLMLQAMGNRAKEGLQGMILPTEGGDTNWFVVVAFHAAGFIKDDDAKDWNADELLSSIRSGTEEANLDWRQRGIPEMEVVGWVEKPHYDAATHRLVWSIAARDKGQSDSVDNGINYNTLALGREGFISMNLVTNLKHVEAQKPMAQTLLAALDYQPGKRYADFNANTDKVAEFGLTALVAGVAAKKLGLFAVIAAFLVKFGKIIGVAVVVGLGAVGKRLWGKRAQAPQDQA